MLLGINFVDTYIKNDLQNMCTKDILLSCLKSCGEDYRCLPGKIIIIPLTIALDLFKHDYIVGLSLQIIEDYGYLTFVLNMFSCMHYEHNLAIKKNCMIYLLGQNEVGRTFNSN